MAGSRAAERERAIRICLLGDRMRGIIQTFALAAVSKCGAVFTHGAPAAQIDSIAELEAADLSGAHYASPLDVLDTPVVGKILWARSATDAEARRFLRAMNGTIAISATARIEFHTASEFFAFSMKIFSRCGFLTEVDPDSVLCV